MLNPYEILGVEVDADAAAISQAYKAKSKECHPDVGGDEEDFKKLNLCYETLKDPEKREIYDSTGIIPDMAADMDPEFALHKEIATIILTIIMEDEINSDELNVITIASELVDKKIAEMRIMYASGEKRRKKLARAVKKITRKEHTSNPVVSLFLKQLQDFDKSLAEAWLKLDETVKMRELLLEYQYHPDAAPPPQARTTTMFFRLGN